MYVLCSLKVYTSNLLNVRYENDINRINRIYSDIMIRKTIDDNYCEVIYKYTSFYLNIIIKTNKETYIFMAKIDKGATSVL